MFGARKSYPVRRLKLNFQDEGAGERYWYNGRPFETHWFNALSLGLPTAEKYAISTIKSFLPKIASSELKHAAQAFIGQEATHSFLHEKCNALLKERGYRFSIERYANWRLSVAHWLHPLTGLALTVCWEHITAILCEHALREIGTYDRVGEPFRGLWIWHCAEELEHKCLAHDVYADAKGGYFRRVAVFVYGTGLFATDFFWLTAHNMYKDGRLFDPRVWFGAAKYLFGRKGLFWHALPRWLAFFNPKYDPDQVDHSALICSAITSLDGRLSEVKRS